MYVYMYVCIYVSMYLCASKHSQTIKSLVIIALFP